MTCKTIQLILKTQCFIPDEDKYHENLTGFLLQYNDSIYGITVHHNLPIDTLYNSTKNPLDIIVNSCWSEALIFKTNYIDITQYDIFKKIQNKIPNIHKTIYTIINNKRVIVKFIETKFEPFDGFNNSPNTPYMLFQLKDKSSNFSYETVAGNSGAPVYINENNVDILIGVLTKYRPDNNIIYVIPIYLFIKSIEKKDNNNIYGIDYKMNINKIGQFNVSNNNYGKIIYHPLLKISIPLSTYFLIEGDNDTLFTISYSDTSNLKNKNIVNNVNTIILNSSLIVSHESCLLIHSTGQIKVNLRLLSLLKRITNIEIQKIIFSKIQKNILLTKNNDFWLNLKLKL
jgi:hypothetical protein